MRIGREKIICRRADVGEIAAAAARDENLGAGIGKASFPEADLKANFDAFLDAIVKAKPAGAKGKYLQKVAMSSSMGPGVKLALDETA